MTRAHLARIRLNPMSRHVQRDLRDATELHRTVMRLVPDHLGDHARQQTGLLFRLDETDDTSTLLVQAHNTGLDPTRLPHDYGHAEVKDLAPMFTALAAGLRVRYRIAANPSKRQRLPLDHRGARGPVTPLSGPEADQWWMGRAASAGLAVHTLTATPLRPAQQHGHGPRLRHSLTRFDGTATVTDPKVLTEALLAGIGKGKAYGAGLLSLAPATTA
ncbi:type I-E CRISPR-associated protein Cas6/Cse3/CasE [Streptacidiphilus sp. ASG 303]|uniref:type I-E CRISPR-associated protein Cas6/Cse3/CasE n=1 Tax=Streptacidiphilus sp. ASG 303 TaxID=2896847 RepID=UPI001E4E30F5|nr:type I-E CRISPR-associated protein Cas6/Cse3/CasE [Streptacidiphilus sp. ASG 303]MCD0485205.1 type I-E CRISPR-associated protein Cas6/Cse3/CasE [Streptacidiphilus sp. ASG 303]